MRKSVLILAIAFATSALWGQTQVRRIPNLEVDACYVNTAIVFEGSVDDAYETSIVVTNPTSDVTLTLPATTGTIALLSDIGGGGGSGAAGNDVYLNDEATGGTGTLADPWTGWETAITGATEASHFHFSARDGGIGYYSTSSQLALTVDGHVFSGDGPGASIIQCRSADGCISIDLTSAGNAGNVTFRDLQFTKAELDSLLPTALSSGAKMIDIIFANRAVFDNVSITGSSVADYTSTGVALALTDINSAWLLYPHIRGYDSPGARFSVGVDIANSVSANRGNVTFVGGIIERATTGVKVASGASNLVNNIQLYGTKLVLNGTSAQTDGVGIDLYTQAEAVTLNGVHIEAYNKGVNADAIRNLVITGSNISKFQAGTTPIGIHLQNAVEYSRIDNNRFNNTTTGVSATGILLDATAHNGIALGQNYFTSIDTRITDSTSGGVLNSSANISDGKFRFKDTVQANALTVGDGTDANSSLTFDQGTGTDPRLIWNDSGAALYFDFNATFDQNDYIFKSTGEMVVPKKITFEGTTNDGNEVTLQTAGDDPNGVYTVTLPNSTGAMVLSSFTNNAIDGVNSVWLGINQIVFESATANDWETSIVSGTIGADVALTLPTTTGTLVACNGSGTCNIDANGITEGMLKVVDTASDEECFTYETTTGDFEWQACAAGAGDVTAVGPGYASGETFTDGVASVGTSMFVWEGTGIDTNELTIIAPSANPGADIDITLPSATGTLATQTDTGTLDWGGATSVEIPNGTAPTVNAAGEVALDTTDDQFVYYGAAKRVLNYREVISVALLAPNNDDPLLFKAPYGVTITDIDCIVDPADTTESVVIDVQECDATGDTCATVDTTITCDNDGAADDGAFSNAAIDANDWVMLDIGTVTGTVSKLAVTIIYTIDAQ